MAATWTYFRKVLGAKMRPSWFQMALDIDPKASQKHDHLLHAFKIEFSWFLAPTWEGQGGLNYHFLEVFFKSGWALGESWGQEGTKAAPRPPQTPPKTDFLVILDPQTLPKPDFLLILEPNLVDNPLTC